MISRQRLASSITAVAILAAIVLAIAAIARLDKRPRTHDAFLLADTADLAPDVSGRIVAIEIHDNQRVTKGQRLLDIDPEPFDLKIRQAQSQVSALQSQIDLTARQIEAQNSAAGAATSQVARARVQLALARDSRARLEPMTGKGYVTEQKMDEARANERSAQSSLEAAIQQSMQARQAITDAGSLIAQEHGAAAMLAMAERDRRNASLVAPFDGLIVGLQIAEGSYAMAGHPLFSLIKTDTWYALGNFRETELKQIRVGDPAVTWILEDNHQPIQGQVESLGWGVRPEDSGVPGLPSVPRSLSWVIVAQRFPVRIKLINPPQGLMRIGATVTVAVHP